MRCLLCDEEMGDLSAHLIGTPVMRVAVCGYCMGLYVSDSPARVVIPSEKAPSMVRPEEAKS